MAAPRGAHRRAEAARRDGRGRARVRERPRVPAVAAARVDTGRAAALHAHDRGAAGAGHRLVARRGAGEDSVLERVQGGRPLVGRAPALLGLGLFGLLVAYYETSKHFPDVGVWWD